MKYNKFESIISQPRMGRYLLASQGNKRKAMTLYRYNHQLSQELLTVISCFEVALRNTIDCHYVSIKGVDWLRDSILPNGMFSTQNCSLTANIIREGLSKLRNGTSIHNRLIAELGFGFWRFLFARNQFRESGRSLLTIFPNKPSSSAQVQYNNIYVFNELEKINKLRNRIAHHEPICFMVNNGVTTKSTQYARDQYAVIIELFHWLDINAADLLFGLDHVLKVCDKIDRI